MILSERNEPTVIVKHLRIAFLVRPVYLIDAVRRLKAIMYALLRAQQFLAGKHEGYALRREDCRLCQQVETDKHVVCDSRD